MALRFQNVPIDLVGGEDKRDSFLVSPPKVTRLENCTFEDAQTPVIRAPLQTHSATDDATAANIQTAYRLSAPGPLYVESGTGLNRVSADGAVSNSRMRSSVMPNDDTFTPVSYFDSHHRTSLETTNVARPTVYQAADQPPSQGSVISFDTAQTATRICHAWVELRPNSATLFQVGWVLQDSATKQTIRTGSYIINGTEATNVRVLANGTKFNILFHVDANVLYGGIVYADGSTPAAAVAIAGTTLRAFDAAVHPTTGEILVFAQTSAVQHARRIINSTTYAVITTTTAAVTDSTLGVHLLVSTLASSSNPRLVCLYTTLVGGADVTLKGHAVNYDGTSVTAETNISTVVGTRSPGRLCALDAPEAASTDAFVWYDLNVNMSRDGYGTGETSPNVDDADSRIRCLQFNVNTLAVVASLSGTPYGVTLAGRVTRRAGSGSINPTYFIPTYYGEKDARFDACGILFAWRFPTGTQAQVVSIIGRFAQGEYISGRSSSTMLPGAYLSGTQLSFSYFRYSQARAVVPGGSLAPYWYLEFAEFDFGRQALGYSAHGATALLPGSATQIACERSWWPGFCHAPTVYSAVEGVGGSLTALGTYSFRVTYVYRDDSGKIYESAPSSPVTVTLTGVNNNVNVNWRHAAGYTNLVQTEVRVYRTTNNGSVYYLTKGNGSTFTDNDTALVSAQRLYTDGGVLPNDVAPPGHVAALHQNRLWLAGAEDGLTVWFSQPLSEGVGPEWSQLLFRRIPTDVGRVRGLVSLDDKLLILGTNSIGYIYGTGPTRTGANDNYSEYIEAVPDTGVAPLAEGSVIETEGIVWFQSQAGLRGLTRAISTAQDGQGGALGSELDSFFNTTSRVTRAVYVAEKSNVRFYTNTSTCLVFDQIRGQWSSLTNYSNIDAAPALRTDTGKTAFFHVRQGLTGAENSSLLWVDTLAYVGTTDPDSSTFNMVVETGWLAFAGLQGFERVTHMMLLGSMPALGLNTPALSVNVTAYYNYDTSAGSQTVINTTLVNTAGKAFWQCEGQLPVQKCEAVKFVITLGKSASGLFQTVRLTNMDLRVGLKQGRFKAPQRF